MAVINYGILILLFLVTACFILLYTPFGNTVLVKLLPRPQTPKRRPYRIRSVTFAGGEEGVTLAGELTLPVLEGPFPAVILIAGSGALDRDQDVSGHKFLLVLSDYLTRNGYAVLRYDKRGVGQSSGDFATSTLGDFAGDAAAAQRWLKMQRGIDPARIGYAGHSSGGYIAPLAAQEEGAAFLVLLAGPVEDLGQTLLRQNKAIDRARNESADRIDLKQLWISEFIRIFKTAADPDHAGEQVRQAFSKYGNAPGMSKKELDVFLAQVPPAWLMWGLNHDPLPVLKAYEGPVLVLFGDKDLQVPAAPNARLMEAVLARRKIPGPVHNVSEVVVFKDRNHLFQPSETGLPEAYLWIKTTCDEAVMERITAWLDCLPFR